MNNNLLPAVIPKYRIIEFNSAYDFMFGEGKGWICCTNFIYNILEAHLWCVHLNKTKNMKHEVITI